MGGTAPHHPDYIGVAALLLGMTGSLNQPIYHNQLEAVLGYSGYGVVQDVRRQVHLVLGGGKGRNKPDDRSPAAHTDYQAVFKASAPDLLTLLVGGGPGFPVLDELDTL